MINVQMQIEVILYKCREVVGDFYGRSTERKEKVIVKYEVILGFLGFVGFLLFYLDFVCYQFEFEMYCQQFVL